MEVPADELSLIDDSLESDSSLSLSIDSTSALSYSPSLAPVRQSTSVADDDVPGLSNRGRTTNRQRKGREGNCMARMIPRRSPEPSPPPTKKRRGARTRGGVRTRGGINIRRCTRGVAFDWKNDGRKEKRKFIFRGTAGVNVQPKDPSCVLEVFKTFITDKMVNHFVDFTNTYTGIVKK